MKIYDLEEIMKDNLLKKIVLILCILIITPVIIVNATPTPVALITRKMFEKQIPTKPSNYQVYENKVVKIKDLSYKSKDKKNNYDVYIPKGAEKIKCPTIIWVHGGAFVGGDKKQVDIFATTLASNGYVILSMNYELAPEAKYPIPIMQLEEFYSHIASIKTKYPIDENQLFFAGDSAGAQIVSQFLAIQTNKAFADKMGSKQIVPKDSIKGALLYCGPYDIEQPANPNTSFLTKFWLNQTAWVYIGKRNYQDSEEIKEMSTVNYVTKDFPPSFITDGNTASFESHGKELAKKLEQNNVEAQTLFFSKEQYITEHEYQFKLDNEPGFKVLQDSINFLKNHTK
ncbi:alpha/beta hydrolase [Clostridium botulinum]|uniref:alpha/beta hydrolase n=1 Tax=Clostridium botulinum TaxID=1491 RepID=UPI00211AE07D|nr:alpha/beta hydrolase [Clostridium botulinum]